MAEFSKIAWTTHTFNPWVGCTKVSPACDGCYAEQWSKRAGRPELWSGKRSRTSNANWKKPIKWNQWPPVEGQRQRVFCASLADVFDNQVPQSWRDDLFALMRQTPNLDWLLLTKRPQNILKMLPKDWGCGYLNVWLGTTIENVLECDRRWPIMRKIPAVVKFISAEPLLEPWSVDDDTPDADWIIVGGESNQGSHRARHMDPDWARCMRDACNEIGIPFFMKQMSALVPIPVDLMVRQFPNPGALT